MTFGRMIRDRRIARGFTLRSFCRQYNRCHGNQSKMETEEMGPPRNPDLVEMLLDDLSIPSYERDKYYILARDYWMLKVKNDFNRKLKQ